MPSDSYQLTLQIGYQFKNEELLIHALSHRSTGDNNNERLEFLGDAILSAIIAEALFKHYPQASEGDLSRMRSLLVSGVNLAELAKKLELGNYIKLGVGEIKSGGQHRQSILADALEALLGAIYLDSDLQTCRECVLKWFSDQLDKFEIHQVKDPKSRLQEWTQSHKLSLPVYKATISGKPHEQTFMVVCEVHGLPHSTIGSSTNRRKAEQLAASLYLDLLS